VSYPDIPARLNITSLVLDRHLMEGRAERTALYFADRRFTYGALSQMVNACGNALLRGGLARGDRVLIRSTNCPEYLATFLAALKIGCVPIPTNSLFRSWELEHILRNSGARAAFTMLELLEPVRMLQERASDLEVIVTFDGAAGGGS
jgi:acyl-coenzyme A synthetase/AMP-(fatty) acid ligase